MTCRCAKGPRGWLLTDEDKAQHQRNLAYMERAAAERAAERAAAEAREAREAAVRDASTPSLMA